MSDSALNLLTSYLSQRQQCVKLGDKVSTWRNIYKGVPQGSILGPVLFNIFLNDIFSVVKTCSLYNYADDNTLSLASPSLTNLIHCLESESKSLIDWFSDNRMKANPDKFQAIAVGKKTKKRKTLNLIFLTTS